MLELPQKIHLMRFLMLHIYLITYQEKVLFALFQYRLNMIVKYRLSLPILILSSPLHFLNFEYDFQYPLTSPSSIIVFLNTYKLQKTTINYVNNDKIC